MLTIGTWIMCKASAAWGRICYLVAWLEFACWVVKKLSEAVARKLHDIFVEPWMAKYVDPLISQYWRERLPNDLTWSRIAGAIIVVLGFIVGSPTAIFAIYMIAILTDPIDGYLARRWHTETELGMRLDPWADKGVFWLPWLSLLHYGAIDWNQVLETSMGPVLVVQWTTYVVCLYDVLLGIIARWLDKNMRTTWIAKRKTVVLLMSLGIVLGHGVVFGETGLHIGFVGLALATALTALSAMIYAWDLTIRTLVRFGLKQA